MLVYTRRKIPACFTDVTSITTCSRKFIQNARTEPIRLKQALNFRSGENKIDFNRFIKPINKFAQREGKRGENKKKDSWHS